MEESDDLVPSQKGFLFQYSSRAWYGPMVLFGLRQYRKVEWKVE